MALQKYNYRTGEDVKTPINDKLKSNKKKTSTTTILDYYWMYDYNVFIPEDEKINYPKMILSEFQPIPNLGFESLLNSLKKAGRQLNSMFEGGSDMAVQAYNYANGDKQENYVTTDKIEAGTEFMKNLLSGYYINVFEIPYVAQDYLVADGGSGWTAGSEGGMFKEVINSLTSFLDGGGAPTMPTWKKSDTKLSHSSEFFLVNDTLEHAKQNFKFIHNIIQGAFWIQNEYQQISPNLYQIEVPGRFKCYLASMKLTVTFEGQIRKDTEFTSAVGLPVGALMPDAYKLSFELAELVDSNFNMYADYMKNMQDAQSGSSSSFAQGAEIGSSRESLAMAKKKSDAEKLEAKLALAKKKAIAKKKIAAAAAKKNN